MILCEVTKHERLTVGQETWRPNNVDGLGSFLAIGEFFWLPILLLSNCSSSLYTVIMFFLFVTIKKHKLKETPHPLRCLQISKTPFCSKNSSLFSRLMSGNGISTAWTTLITSALQKKIKGKLCKYFSYCIKKYWKPQNNGAIFPT